MMKRILVALGALIVLLAAVAVIIPLVVDVDKYRPQIVEKADGYLNGKLQLGKLSLSLWGQVRVQVQGLSVTDARGRKVLAVDDAFFHIPFSSFLVGSPSIDFKMNKPLVNAIKDKSGKLNLLTLVKSQSTGAEPKAASTTATPAGGGGGQVALPAIVTRARFGFEMLDAHLVYNDESTGLKNDITGMNLVVHDLSLTRTANIEFWAELHTVLGKSFALNGPMRLKGTAEPKLADGKLDHVTLNALLNLDDLEMTAPRLFEKKKGVAANVDLSVVASEKEVRIDRANVKFFNADIKSSGALSNLSEKAAVPGQPAPAADPVVRYTLQSNEIELKPWVQLIPMLKDYDLGGTASFGADANGPAQKLQYKADLKLNALTAKAPQLKAQPRFDGEVKISTDRLDSLLFTMKAPANDLTISGTMPSLMPARGTFSVRSASLDLDQLINLPQPGQKKAAGASAGAGSESTSANSAAKPRASDLDAMVAPIRENKMLASAAVDLGVDMKLIKIYDIRMSNVASQMSFKDLVATIKSFSMGLWKGAIKASMATDLRPAHPTYRFNADVDHLEMQEAVASQLQLFKNTLLGNAHFEMSGQGASYNADAAISNLNAKGNMKVTDATFATIDILKMVSDALNSSIAKVADKVPPLRGKTIPAPAGGKSKYQYISSSFTISGGKFSAPDFTAKAAVNQGIDLAGATTVGLKDYSLDTSWKVIDTYNLTHARDLAVNIGGTNVPHILAKGNDPVQFTVHATGTCSAPKYSYAEVPEQLAKVAAENVAQAATGKAKAAVQKQLGNAIQKAPPAVQNQLNNLGKKLFGH